MDNLIYQCMIHRLGGILYLGKWILVMVVVLREIIMLLIINHWVNLEIFNISKIKHKDRVEVVLEVDKLIIITITIIIIIVIIDN